MVASRYSSEGRAGRLAVGGPTATRTPASGMWVEDASHLLEATSKARRSSRPDITVGLEALYHHFPLGLILPEVPEE
jgi:hypothetical protein